jgi:hypothetical protein
MGVEYPALAQAGLLANAMLVSMAAYLVTGAFISVLYYPPFWYLIAFVLTLDRAVNAEYDQMSSEGKNAPEGDTHNRNGRARGGGKNPGAGRPRLAGRV